jgi:hypothetical protein
MQYNPYHCSSHSLNIIVYYFIFVIQVIQTYTGIIKPNTEGAIRNRQSRESCNIKYTRRRQTKQKTQHSMLLDTTIDK